MRLINTHTLVLDEFFGSNIPPYAILSHAWGKEEVTYQEWIAWQDSGDRKVKAKQGFYKITEACRQARQDQLDWLWVDTNCIDKASSSELSEAINSMFAWYRDSVLCYAFLIDVAPHQLGQVGKSRWFTRGWTLQELLAPKRLIFYTNTWDRIGSRSRSLIGIIQETTGIEACYLTHEADLATASVAKKMSWLSTRTTTRTEDMAYCMLGLFKINMPLLYGEGTRAFARLQNEIIRQVHDHTIFCWDWTKDTPSTWVSMLAPSPRSFRNSGDYEQRKWLGSLSPYSITNVGLSISFPIIYTAGNRLFAVLDAGMLGNVRDERTCIPLRQPEERAMFFERESFPPTPLNLYLLDPNSMDRQSMIILTQSMSLNLNSRRKISSTNFGVILLIHPYGDNAGSGIPNGKSSSREQAQISTYPPNMFDGARDLFVIPRPSRRGTKYHTLSIEIDLGLDSDPLRARYVLFFAIDISKNNEWHCNIAVFHDERKEGHMPSAPRKPSLQDVHLTRCANLGHIARDYPSHEARLALNKRLWTDEGMEVRPCIVLGLKRSRIYVEEDGDGVQNDVGSAVAVALGV